MIASAPFGDVVEQRGHVQHPRLVPAGGQLGTEWVLVRMFGDEEAAHVAQHHQDVLIHRVDVKQVVLHLPHDAPEHPEVASEHRGLVHQPHRMRDAGRLLKDAQKRAAVDRVVTEGCVHHGAHVVERAQGAGRQSAQAQVRLVQQEGLQNRMGMLLVEVVAGHLDHAGLLEEAFVDRAQCVGGGAALGLQALFDVEQQDLVQLGYRLGRPVVAFHQGLARTVAGARVGGGGGRVAERFGHRRLEIEHQAVLATAGDQVQPGPDQAQQGLVVLDLAHLERCGQALAGEFVPAFAQPCGARHPQDDLQVAQTAGRFLAVGLQGVGRVLELGVTLAHLQGLGHEEGLRVHGRVETPAEIREQARVAVDQPGLQQGGLHGYILGGLRQAVGRGSHAGSDFKADVPATADEGFDARLEGVVGLGRSVVRQHQQNVDIRVGEELPAAESADGHQGERRVETGMTPQAAHEVVGERGQRAQRRVHAARGRAAGSCRAQEFALVVAKPVS